LLTYFERNWLKHVRAGLLDYSKINQKYRATSLLENYNKELKQRMHKNPSWPEFVQLLQSEEHRFYQKLTDKERKGQVKHRPLSVKGFKIINLDLDEDWTDIEDTNLLVFSKAKSVPTPIHTDLPSQNLTLVDLLPSFKTTPDSSLLNQFSKKRKLHFVEDEESRLVNQKKVKLNSDDERDWLNRDWLRWSDNSCRYDSFLTVVTLVLYNKEKFMRAPISNTSLVHLQNACFNLNYRNFHCRLNLWHQYVKLGLDKHEIGSTGHFDQLLRVLGGFEQFNLKYRVKSKCTECHISYSDLLMHEC